MSKSYKKYPIIKDKSGQKQNNIYNKRYRRVCKNIANQLKYNEDKEFPLHH